MLKQYDIDQHNIRINNLNGTFQVVAANLMVPFVTIFAKRLYASDLQIALINSLPAIVSVGAIIPGALYIQRSCDKKKITGRFFIGARIFYLLCALVPFLAKQYQASMFVLLYGFMNLPGSIALSSWQSFVAGIFPPALRARAMALRNRLSTFLGVITTLLTGLMLYNIPRTDDERILMYQAFFAAAFLFSIVEICIFYKHRVPSPEENKMPVKNDMTSMMEIMNGIKSNRRFIFYCMTALIFHFAWYMAWPLFPLYEIDVLHSNEVWTSLFSSINGAVAAISYPYWGKFVEKKGNALPLTIAAFLMAIVPFSYPFSNSLYILLPISAAGGASVSGITLIVLNTLFEITPDENRTVYIAVFNTMLNIVLIFAPFVGIALKNSFNIYQAFIIAGFLRLSAGAVFYARYKREKRIAG